MHDTFILILLGFLIGTAGTLLGAGGGFVLVPILMLMYPDLPTEIITAISIAIVGFNAISGTVAYARAKRIDYKAGFQFALFTIPGSILGAIATKYISRGFFDIMFSALLIILSIYLLFQKQAPSDTRNSLKIKSGWRRHYLSDRNGIAYSYTYNSRLGNWISLLVGFISPLLGIGGGIIHVPALVHWVRFPVHIATATSHFILAIMSLGSIIVHMIQGNYNQSSVLNMVTWLGVGAIAGAQLGALLSGKITGDYIMKLLAVVLGLVGVRILIWSF